MQSDVVVTVSYKYSHVAIERSVSVRMPLSKFEYVRDVINEIQDTMSSECNQAKFMDTMHERYA